MGRAVGLLGCPVIATVFFDDGLRSQFIADCLSHGLLANGVHTETYHAGSYNARPRGDIACFYGLKDKLFDIYKDFISSGRKVLFVDLGFFRRKVDGSLDGYYRVTVNEMFPHKVFTGASQPKDRLMRLQLPTPAPMRARENGYILLAGMSAKSAGVNGYAPNEWETKAIVEIRKHTTRNIIYRPKPSYKEAVPLLGCNYAPGTIALEPLLEDAHCVVTHHSNVAIDGLMVGVPCFVDADSPAKAFSGASLADLERLPMPTVEAREAWLGTLAYQQWMPWEIRRGYMHQQLVRMGLLT